MHHGDLMISHKATFQTPLKRFSCRMLLGIKCTSDVFGYLSCNMAFNFDVHFFDHKERIYQRKYLCKMHCAYQSFERSKKVKLYQRENYP